LKFLLKLLSFPDYRAPLSKVAPNSKTPAAERERICRKLRDRNLVDYSCEITKFKITPLGKERLKLDTDELPVTPEELKLLKACERKTITPAKTGIAEAQRQSVIQSLADRGLIQFGKRDQKIKEVWLTEEGKTCLREEYEPRGAGNITLTKKMLADYLQFLRESLSSSPAEFRQKASICAQEMDSSQEVTDEPSDEEILKTIDDLDWKLRTKNYLPIFYLREKLQPQLSREELDQVLFRLEKNNQIELRAIKEAWRYSDEEFNAGIPQRLGSRLFFIRLK
ncbi:MAG TPA: hypothetical protein V6D11_22260, partial [Waterburya sp.]